MKTPLSGFFSVSNTEASLENTIFDKYDTVIFDLDGTIWDCFSPSGVYMGAYKTNPPYELKEKNTIVDASGNVITLQKGIREVLKALDDADKNLGIMSTGEKLADVEKRIPIPTQAQPSIMLLKKFGIYQYFNYDIILKAFSDKYQYVHPKGKTLFIDDKQENTMPINDKPKIDALWRGSFHVWEDLLQPRTTSSKIAFAPYFDSTPSEEVVPEDVNYTHPLTDQKLRRTNPKRYDQRNDWYTNVNEHGHDSPESTKTDNTIQLSASLHKIADPYSYTDISDIKNDSKEDFDNRSLLNRTDTAISMTPLEDGWPGEDDGWKYTIPGPPHQPLEMPKSQKVAQKLSWIENPESEDDFVSTRKDWIGNLHYYDAEGKLHRNSGPAIENASGAKMWYNHGMKHRVDGPAVMYTNGWHQWFLNNQLIGDSREWFTDEDFEKYKREHGITSSLRLSWLENPPEDDFVKEKVDEFGNIYRYDEDNELHSLHSPAIEWKFGDKEWYNHGKLHRDDGPAHEFVGGGKEYWKNGNVHRLDGPAVVWNDGTKFWHINNHIIGNSLDGFTDEDFENYKREHGITSSLKQSWLELSDYVREHRAFDGELSRFNKEGVLHSLYSPAIERRDGSKEWFQNGKHHRLDGPAIEYSNGVKEWWINGKYLGNSSVGYTDEDFENFKKTHYITASSKTAKKAKELFLCFWVPEDVKKKLQGIQNLEEDLHVTLYYNGQISVDKEELLSRLSYFVKHEFTDKIKCSFAGIGEFNSKDKPLVALINMKNGAEFRSNLANIIEEVAEDKVNMNFDFQPHCTLSYTKQECDISKLPKYSWTPSYLSVIFSGEDKKYLIDLSTGKVKESLKRVASNQRSKVKLSWLENSPEDDFVEEKVVDNDTIAKYDSDGNLHSLHSPAIEYADVNKEWYNHGKLHRLDGPAIEWATGDKEWYQNGKRHRVDGPAVEDTGGNNAWYLNGKFLGLSNTGFTDAAFEQYKREHGITSSLHNLASETPGYDYDPARHNQMFQFEPDNTPGRSPLDMQESYHTDYFLQDNQHDEKELETKDWNGRENLQLWTSLRHSVSSSNVLKRLGWLESPSSAATESMLCEIHKNNIVFFVLNLQATELYKSIEYVRHIQNQEVDEGDIQGMYGTLSNRIYTALREFGFFGHDVDVYRTDDRPGLVVHNIDVDKFYAAYPTQDSIVELLNTITRHTR